jgi:hypothetical protein
MEIFMSRRDRRFHRQFEALSRLIPALRGPLGALRGNRRLLIRLPLAILLIIGGLFSFLPLLGVWMLPAGLLLLAVDLPFLRAPLSALLIRTRRRVKMWVIWWRRRRAG